MRVMVKQNAAAYNREMFITPRYNETQYQEARYSKTRNRETRFSEKIYHY